VLLTWCWNPPLRGCSWSPQSDHSPSSLCLWSTANKEEYVRQHGSDGGSSNSSRSAQQNELMEYALYFNLHVYSKNPPQVAHASNKDCPFWPSHSHLASPLRDISGTSITRQSLPLGNLIHGNSQILLLPILPQSTGSIAVPDSIYGSIFA